MNILRVIDDQQFSNSQHQTLSINQESKVILDRKLRIGSFDCVINENHTILHLGYPPIQDYDAYFDQLDTEISSYKSIKNLIMITDYIYEIPPTVKKFQNLEYLNLIGSRWWDLNMTQVPKNVSYLRLTNQTNLQPECLEGMENLTNLKQLYLDMAPFDIISSITHEWCYHYREKVQNMKPNINLVDLSSLKLIVFDLGIGAHADDIIDNWKEVLLAHPLFKNIKHRIDNMYHSLNDNYPDTGCTGLYFEIMITLQ